MAQVDFAGLHFQCPYFQSATATRVYFEKKTGVPLAPFYEFYERIASSHPGMIIVQHANVEARGQADEQQFGIDRDELVPYHEELVRRIRAVDASVVICSQLAHAGPIAWVTEKRDINNMSADEIEEVIQRFVDAALRAQRAGYDCVEIHSGHTYFLSQTISPYFNKRTDKYAWNTYYCLSRVVQQIKAAAPKMVVGVKLQAEEFMQDQGINAERTAQLLKQLTFDFVEISGGARGGTYPTIRKGQDVFYYKHVIQKLVEEGIIQQQNILVTGGFENVQHAQEALDMGCKMAGFSRKFLRNPTFLIKDDKKCVRCAQCGNNGGICLLVEKGL